jgi:hypothetical protein
MYKLDILEKDKNFEVINTGEKLFHNCDNKFAASDWVRLELKKIKKEVRPNMSSALVVSNKDKKIAINAIGSMNNNSNQIYKSGTEVFITTSPTSLNANVDIIPENIYKVLSLFTVRKSVKINWINEKDEYVAPDETHPEFKIFKIDSIVYSLFNSGSAQSSLRQITYKDQLWDIKNEFFWMSKNEMTGLANQNNYTELYNDARTDSDRYVHTLLFGEEGIYDQLSNEAKDVLDSATNLVRLSFGMRRNFADDTNHLNSWDAGYAQLKLLWKEYYPEQFKEFRAKYKVLEDKMRPMVYELGFLLK